MKRRRIILVVVLLLAVAGLAVGFDPHRRILGWARGEPFYQGHSASAWRRDLVQSDEAAAAEAFNTLVSGKGDAIPVCAWALKNSSEAEARWKAADVLGHMGKDGAAAGPDLVAALGDSDPLVRKVAVRAVGELAPDVPGAIPGLVALFPDIEAIRAVARFGRAGADAVPALTKLFTNDDKEVRWQAARAIGKIGEPARAAVPDLMRRTVEDPDWEVREHAAEALGDLGPAAADAVPALVKALHDPNARVRRDAVRSLGQIGTAAKLALPEVQAMANDPDENVKTAAVRAARLIDPAGAKK